MKQVFLFALAFATFTIASCNKDDGTEQAEIDEEIIVNYIEDNGLDAIATGSGLYVVVEEEGTGVNPTLVDEVAVFYKGYLTNGQIFDLTGVEPATFQLNSVIEGWQEGIPYFKPGGNGILLVPSALGYGNRALSGIPANSVLIFEVELVRVN